MAANHKSGRRGVAPTVESPTRTGKSLPLASLHFDPANPRLVGYVSDRSSEVEILNTIVDLFGIDDVLSSIAVNGYFDAEPMVGLRDPDEDSVRIVEGNRRLAACLILAGDPRARDQAKRTRDFQVIQNERGRKPVTHVPVLLYDESAYSEALLPYLGVRHIAASQPWDSYAKAAWVAKVLKKGRFSLETVSQMIGDQHRTVARLLEGYYFVNQLIESGRFNPQDSLRRGRGSNPEYPFSWVYTALGFSPVRKWLGLEDLTEGRKKSPIPKGKADDAGELMIFLLGNKSRKREPAISDSRQIADLAIALGDPERRDMLRLGKTIEEIVALSRPVAERMSEGLFNAQEALKSVLVPLSQGEITEEQARPLDSPSKKVKWLAVEVHKKIVSLILGEENEQDG
jgi:hypothetical protein